MWHRSEIQRLEGLERLCLSSINQVKPLKCSLQSLWVDGEYNRLVLSFCQGWNRTQFPNVRSLFIEEDLVNLIGWFDQWTDFNILNSWEKDCSKTVNCQNYRFHLSLKLKQMCLNFYTISAFVFVCIFVDSGRAWWYFGGELMAKAKGRGWHSVFHIFILTWISLGLLSSFLLLITWWRFLAVIKGGWL